MRDNSFAEDAHPALAEFRALARETAAWLLVGSLTVKVDDALMANRSYLLAPDGAVAASLRQDPHVRCHPAERQVIREFERLPSRRPRGGGADAVGRAWHDRLLRPALPGNCFGALARAGALFLAVPSSSSARPALLTGTHCCARAPFENLSYVLAPAMCGEHRAGVRPLATR